MEPRVQVTPVVRAGPELSVIIPSFNERDNVPVLVTLLDKALAGIAWEAIVVDDDSPDGTAQVVKALAARDPRVRCIHRVGRRGLAGACIEGILSSAAPVVAVIDADLQHDETLLPRMLDQIRAGADLVVGSRYVAGGEAGEGFSSWRKWGSETATRMAKKLLKIDLTDPMSGFFMIRREKVEAVASDLASQGFKILLDIVASSKEPLKSVELPYSFRERNAGESKLDSQVTADYLGLLFSKLSGGVVPIRFLMFMAVGASGVLVHLAVLNTVMDAFTLKFAWAQFVAVMVSMTWNFILNNYMTYRDRRLTGLNFLIGLLTFYIVCSFGMIANVGVASWIYDFQPMALWAGFAGAIMGAVFNYAASSVLTWHQK